MNSSEIKKRIERRHLTDFFSNEDLTYRVYSIQDSETPDFIVNVDTRLTSIEHTRLINPFRKNIEEYYERIIRNAKLRFESRYSEKLYVLLTFNEREVSKGRDAQEKYTDEIFNLIENIYLCNKKLRFRIRSRSRLFPVSQLIESFEVNNEDNFSHWQHFGSYSSDRIDIDWLQDIISRKDRKIDKYSQKFEENWLLLVTDFGTKASGFQYEFTDYSPIKTRFDKVYLYAWRADEVVSVK